MPKFHLAILLITISLANLTHAAQAHIAVAANFAQPLQKIASAFEADTQHKLVISLGATGKFYAQIKNGAPFDVLLSADSSTPDKLVQEGLALATQRLTYATGRLALWSKNASLVDNKDKDNKGTILGTDKFERLALADPLLAPYGAAAMQVLGRLQLADKLKPKLVMGENISQAYQFVATGNAELGFVALSQVFEAGKIREGSAWIVPSELHSPIRQDAVLLMQGRGNAAAQAWMRYLGSDKARRIIQSYGYE